jgi:hypothetical protein
MLHDYMMYGADSTFIINKLAGERQIMNYFNGFQAADGSLKNLPNWAFADWANGPGWRRGMGPVGNEYLSWLDVWRKNMALGLTTWAETSDVERTRSDCHAWGASPNIEFFRTILGIESASPNFKTVRIEPHLGTIKKIGGEMPHPAGKVSVKYEYNGQKFTATIVLPEKTTGTFIWEGKSHTLNAGENLIKL